MGHNFKTKWLNKALSIPQWSLLSWLPVKKKLCSCKTTQTQTARDSFESVRGRPNSQWKQMDSAIILKTITSPHTQQGLKQSIESVKFVGKFHSFSWQHSDKHGAFLLFYFKCKMNYETSATHWNILLSLLSICVDFTDNRFPIQWLTMVTTQALKYEVPFVMEWNLSPSAVQLIASAVQWLMVGQLFMLPVYCLKHATM